LSTKKLRCATLDFNEAKEVIVESAYVRALPGFSIVGMANQSIQESKERIKASLTSIGFKFPPQKITVSLSPSDLKKEGSHFDLGIALLIYFQKEDINLEEYFIFGELGLDGSVRATSLIFPILLSLAAKKESIKVLVPASLLPKTLQIPNIKAFGVENLQEAIAFLANEEKTFCDSQPVAFANEITIENKTYYYEKNFELDFKEVKSQNRLKRALVICAAGMHNILLEGSPGSGKSMSLKRLRYILPPMSIEEMMESNAYNCLVGNDEELSATRVFRAPHHTSSKPSIFGGGSLKAVAGECALAHNGILFFDEFPHFSKTVLESLREPLEDNQVLISRVNSKVKYETKFLFAAAQNPCPCGNLLSNSKECRCSELEILRYKNRISEPIMDRIDIYFQMDEGYKDSYDLSSKEMFEQVLRAFENQKRRGQKELNANLSEAEIETYCELDTEANKNLQMAINRYGLSFRSVAKVKKIARTIADIESSHLIKNTHILEALSYRKR
jgi:magnesium chelatase family protein